MITWIRDLTMFIAYIEFVFLIILTGINVKRGIIRVTLRLFDKFLCPSSRLHSSVEPVLNRVGMIYETYETLLRGDHPGSRLLTGLSQESEYIYMMIETPYILRANEHWHIVQDPSSPSANWHIGLVVDIVDSDNNLVMCLDVFVDVSSFYTFPIDAAKSYLIQVAEEDENAVILAENMEYNIRVNGLRDLPDSQVIVKTYWIRIIQRRWKRIYSERMRQLKLRGSLKAQRQFELSGKYRIPVGDGLRGMLMSKSNSESANIKTD